jgi:MFS family permease
MTIQNGSGLSTRLTGRIPAGIYYGWYVALGVGLIAFVSWGIGFYQLGVFVQRYQSEYGWSVSSISAGATLFFVLIGLTHIAFGGFIDRYGPRAVLIGGTLALCAGVAAMGQAQSIWQVYVADALLAVGFGATSTLVLGAVVGRWFRRRRTMVMTLALSGAPLGALIGVPVSTALLDRYGLSEGSLILAALGLAIAMPVAVFLIRDTPAARGLQIDGKPLEGGIAGRAVDDLRWTSRQAARTAVWWLLAFSYTAIMLGQVAYLVYQVSFLSPIVGSGRAAALVSVTGAAGLVGRAVGSLGDYVPKHHLLCAYCLVQAAGVFIAATSTGTLMLTASAALVGFTMGNTLALQPVLMAERFGMRSYAAVFGPASLAIQFGAAGGLSLVGVLADWSGGYALPFAITGGLAVLAGLAASASGYFAVNSDVRRALAS